ARPRIHWPCSRSMRPTPSWAGSGALIGLAVILAVGPAAALLGAEAQPAEKVARIGFLTPGSLAYPETRAGLEAFQQGLREQGYTEGQNIAVEYGAADGRIERSRLLQLSWCVSRSI